MKTEFFLSAERHEWAGVDPAVLERWPAGEPEPGGHSHPGLLTVTGFVSNSVMK